MYHLSCLPGGLSVLGNYVTMSVRTYLRLTSRVRISSDGGIFLTSTRKVSLDLSREIYQVILSLLYAALNHRRRSLW